MMLKIDKIDKIDPEELLEEWKIRLDLFSETHDQMLNYFESLQEQLETANSREKGMTTNRNYFCERINDIAKVIGMTGKDHFSPDAILRNVKIKIGELDKMREAIEGMLRIKSLWLPEFLDTDLEEGKALSLAERIMIQALAKEQENPAVRE